MPCNAQECRQVATNGPPQLRPSPAHRPGRRRRPPRPLRPPPPRPPRSSRPARGSRETGRQAGFGANLGGEAKTRGAGQQAQAGSSARARPGGARSATESPAWAQQARDCGACAWEGAAIVLRRARPLLHDGTPPCLVSLRRLPARARPPPHRHPAPEGAQQAQRERSRGVRQKQASVFGEACVAADAGWREAGALAGHGNAQRARARSARGGALAGPAVHTSSAPSSSAPSSSASSSAASSACRHNSARRALSTPPVTRSDATGGTPVGDAVQRAACGQHARQASGRSPTKADVRPAQASTAVRGPRPPRTSSSASASSASWSWSDSMSAEQVARGCKFGHTSRPCACQKREHQSPGE